jgi:hypothetical protein
MTLEPGTLPPRYSVVETISSGATGAVYRARDEESGEDVAVKRMLEVGARTRFEIEARLLAGLHHPRLVAVRDHFEDAGGMYCIVMDLVRGTDLSRMLWDRGAPGLAPPDVVEWARQACEALQYAHEQQVLHGDVKPQNMICGNEGVVLVDFGSATQLDAGASAGAGTPLFMAPEVFAGEPVSPRSDVFGIAATVVHLLNGTPPVYGEAVEAPAELAEALRRGLELRPEERTASAQAFADSLGVPLRERGGVSLAHSISGDALLEAVVRATAGAFDAAAASIALAEPSGELLYHAAWGAGAAEVAGMRLPAGVGIAGAVIASGEPQAVPHCRSDPRFAAQVARGTGYVPHTMLVVPLVRAGVSIGVVSILDRRDGRPYEQGDFARAALFADLVLAAL